MNRSFNMEDVFSGGLFNFENLRRMAQEGEATVRQNPDGSFVFIKSMSSPKRAKEEDFDYFDCSSPHHEMHPLARNIILTEMYPDLAGDFDFSTGAPNQILMQLVDEFMNINPMNVIIAQSEHLHICCSDIIVASECSYNEDASINAKKFAFLLGGDVELHNVEAENVLILAPNVKCGKIVGENVAICTDHLQVDELTCNQKHLVTPQIKMTWHPFDFEKLILDHLSSFRMAQYKQQQIAKQISRARPEARVYTNRKLFNPVIYPWGNRKTFRQ